jgi:hypothetical protein
MAIKADRCLLALLMPSKVLGAEADGLRLEVLSSLMAGGRILPAEKDRIDRRLAELQTGKRSSWFPARCRSSPGKEEGEKADQGRMIRCRSAWWSAA